VTPPDDDPPQQPPKRRRRPPRGLEGFDTGYPEDDDPSGDIQSSPASVDEPARSVVVDPSLATPGEPSPAPFDNTTSRGVPSGEGAAIPSSDGIPGSSGAIPTSSGGMPAAPGAPPTTSGAIPTSSGGMPAAPTTGAMEMAGGYGGGYSAPIAASSLDRDEPLSSAYVGASDSDLRDAVGAKSRRARTPPPDVESFDDDLGGRPRSRKTIVVSILSLVVGLGVAALVFLGRANSAWLYISCEPDRIVAERGRSFPPWGESTLDGKQWAAIKIPPDAECIALETESEDELSDQFRAMLVKRASVLLTAKEVTKTDEANTLLEQALLHARSNTDTARNARADIQRLLGDVAYWRASLKLRDASKALVEAAKQFDAAAQQRPRHVTDAAAWADYVRKVVGELEAGPAGTPRPSFPPPPAPASEPRPPAPPGVALPVEPDQGSASESPQPTPPDAGLPTGGVLL